MNSRKIIISLNLWIYKIKFHLLDRDGKNKELYTFELLRNI